MTWPQAECRCDVHKHRDLRQGWGRVPQGVEVSKTLTRCADLGHLLKTQVTRDTYSLADSQSTGDRMERRG